MKYVTYLYINDMRYLSHDIKDIRYLFPERHA